MKNVSQQFNQQYVPFKALLLYECESVDEDNYRQKQTDIYVESYDIGKQGNPINAHPLSVSEVIQLSELFQSTQEVKSGYLKSRGMLPGNILYINPSHNGFAVWHTPLQEVDLFFVDGLAIPSGKAHIPAMIWKATKDSLYVYALKGKGKLTEKTVLYHAPYFNIYSNGNVCMGTVSINIDRYTCLQDFMRLWQEYFFNSYFSHTIGGHSGASVDLVELWREQVSTEREFPGEVLVKQGMTLKNLMQ
ncbi:PRTRC system protein B [Mucilaginibacter sp. PPCGB 2223]|uniref:PRTRC system protein B n=1 Tax=Mucilaginibacter sp. PPCGB 2223 TaxID=1886027 RepID=UPI0008265DD4|nr:PRTRC system protein B [Mucilaginibacter sp. PPCGB 2223]OCX54224.1 PRTRC system protein B [Mucilaginibacter sp. PPCGB 2223]